MAAVATADLPKNQKDELLCTYAALILHDEKAEISSDNLSKLISAAGCKVEAYWPMLFARMAESKDIGEMLSSAGTPGAAGPAPAAGAAAGEAAAAAPAEEKKEEEEEDEDMGFDLFD